MNDFDVLKILSRCEVFCKFCKLVTEMAVDLIRILRVNFNVRQKVDPLNLGV